MKHALAGKDYISHIWRSSTQYYMVAMKKEKYEAPHTIVVQINSEGIICDSQTLQVIWILDGGSPGLQDSEWGRDGYGTSDEI